MTRIVRARLDVARVGRRRGRVASTPRRSPRAKSRPRSQAAGLSFKFSDFKSPDNSCKAESGSERLLLREKYASKVLLTGEKALQEEVTQVRRAASSTIQGDVKTAGKAALKLEKLAADFEKEIEKDVVGLEQEIVKDVVGLEREVEKDVFGRRR